MPPERATVSLPEAARLIGRPWYTARRLLLTGLIAGEKRRGRWRVFVESLAPFTDPPRPEADEPAPANE